MSMSTHIKLGFLTLSEKSECFLPRETQNQKEPCILYYEHKMRGHGLSTQVLNLILKSFPRLPVCHPSS